MVGSGCMVMEVIEWLDGGNVGVRGIGGGLGL